MRRHFNALANMTGNGRALHGARLTFAWQAPALFLESIGKT